MTDEIIIEPVVSQDPFNGTTSVSVAIMVCPVIDILIHNKYRIPGQTGDEGYELTILPIACLTKDGESTGGLIFSSRFLRGDVASIQVLFDDNTIIEKEVHHVSDNDYNWDLTDEDCECFLFKQMKIVRVNCGNSSYDYSLEAPADLDILYKGLPELFPVVLEQFLMIAAKEAKWVPMSSPKKVTAYIETEEVSFEGSAEFCYVYLMNDTANGYYKIGMANNPEYRESTLQSEKPTIVKVCQKKCPSRKIAHAIESALHRVYGTKRVRGEWFLLKEKDVWEIKQTLS